MEKTDIQTLLEARETLRRDRQRIEPFWEEIAKYINPAMADWDDLPPKTTGKKQEFPKDLYDTTAIKASNLLADGIQGYAFGRHTAWFRLTLEDSVAMREPGVQKWLQECERILYAQLAKSSFYDDGRSFIKCGADFGTAVMRRFEDSFRGVPCYRTQHLKRCYLLDNRFGEVDALIRDVWLTPYEAVEWFRERTPKEVLRAYEKGDLNPFLFYEFIFPPGRFEVNLERGQKEAPFVGVVVADCDQATPVLTGKFSVKPFFVWRWARSLDGDVWGVDSPGMMEIANVKQLNSIRKDYMRMRQLAARPPLKATEGLQGRLKIEPSGVTYLRAGEDFVFSRVVDRIDEIGQDVIGFQKGVHETYHTDFFLILTQNIERIKTATEVAGVQGEKAAMLSAFFGRLSAEFLEPVIEDLFLTELKAGRLPPPPQRLTDKQLKVDMISPLAQLQKRHLTLTPAQQALQTIFALAQLRPEVMDNVNVDEYARMVAEDYQMDRRVLVDLVDVQKIREFRARQQAQIQQMQMQIAAAQTQADIYSKMAKRPEAGSPAEAMAQGGMNEQTGP